MAEPTLSVLERIALAAESMAKSLEKIAVNTSLTRDEVSRLWADFSGPFRGVNDPLLTCVACSREVKYLGLRGECYACFAKRLSP